MLTFYTPHKLRVFLTGMVGFLFFGCNPEIDPGEQLDGIEVDVAALGCSPSGAQPSTRAGMGAVFYNTGTMFRVWAPNAERVFVAGDFNNWSDSANELGSECNGHFSGDLPNALAGQRYKFAIKRQGTTIWKNDPRALDVTNSSGESIIYDQGTFHWDNSFGTPSFNEQVIYEMHIGTFNDSPGFGPGTFASAIAKLDHLQWLGVNMIELMPVAEFAGDFSKGYNPAFPFAPDSAYGDPDFLKLFIDEAHERGIGVLMDVVYNHFGPSDHPMWCFDGECYGAGGIYFYTDWRMNTAWGPRPDYGRSQVRDYIRDNVRLWFDYYHIDGLRWDSTKSIRQTDGGASLPDGYSLMQEINGMINNTQPWKISIAEDFGGGAATTRDTVLGGAGFDSQWDADFFHPVLDTIIAQNDSSRDMFRIRDAITHNFNGQASQRVIYTESHDEVSNGRSRVPEMIWPGNAGSWFSKKRSTLGAALAFTAPGIPMLFQGQEFLEDGFFADTDPLDWSKANTYHGIALLYRDLIRMRRNWFNNTRGLLGDNVNVFHINNNNKLIAFHRWRNGGPGDDVVVVANFSGQTFSSYEIGFPRGGLWYTRLNSDANIYSSDFGNVAGYDTTATSGSKDGLPFRANVGIGPYSVLILSQ
jgi:1,4-alpha-glucan branching enzyme